jgi:hypothetical protein
LSTVLNVVEEVAWWRAEKHTTKGTLYTKPLRQETDVWFKEEKESFVDISKDFVFKRTIVNSGMEKKENNVCY